MTFWGLFSCPLFAVPNPKLGVGEPGFLDLRKGLFIQLMNNDYLGNTDKLMTGSFSLGYLTNSWGIYYTHRLFTPAINPSYGENDYPQPLGINTDVMSLNLFKEIKLDLGAFDGGLGWDHLGENGAGSISRSIHNQIGSPHLNHNQSLKKGDYLNYNLQYSLNIIQDSGLKTGAGTRSDFLLTEDYWFAKYTLAWDFIKLSLAQYAIWHKSSNLIRQTAYRKESTLGIGIGKYYRVYIHYVSPYIKGDHKGQVYLSPLNFQYEW